MKNITRKIPAKCLVVMMLGSLAAAQSPARQLTYPIVDTAQTRCYNNQHEIQYPQPDRPFFGQDAQYAGCQPSYRDNGDGTVSDLVTGLMWQADPGDKRTYAQAVAGAARCRTGGYDDWRLPTIKELYSLIQFNGIDPDPRSTSIRDQHPFIDTQFFKFRYGDPSRGERLIDSQWATATRYRSTTMGGNPTMFGVNFADGRIKGYPISDRRRGTKLFHVIYVRGNPEYGRNRFVDNGDGTITDQATGLTWMQVDSGHLKAGRAGDGRLTWAQALRWAEDLTYAGHDDWRLPNIKELHSIVDYTRCPAVTNSPAIDPIFKTSRILVERNEIDYPFYWSSTTHVGQSRATAAAYIAFGRALGFLEDRRSGRVNLLDVHGAGAQRSDPKSGDAGQFPTGRGPQGDVIRIDNFVRCVRGGQAEPSQSGPEVVMSRQVVSRQGRSHPSVEQEGGRNTMDRRTGEPAAMFVRRLDRDGDGRVSRREFDGPSRRFSDFDRDRDGYIDADEAPTGPPSRRR